MCYSTECQIVQSIRSRSQVASEMFVRSKICLNLQYIGQTSWVSIYEDSESLTNLWCFFSAIFTIWNNGKIFLVIYKRESECLINEESFSLAIFVRWNICKIFVIISDRECHNVRSIRSLSLVQGLSVTCGPIHPRTIRQVPMQIVFAFYLQTAPHQPIENLLLYPHTNEFLHVEECPCQREPLKLIFLSRNFFANMPSWC